MTRVLIVDDSSFMRSSLGHIVEQKGYEIAGTASSGPEAVDLYKTLQPDLVTMDIMMKGGDGISAVHNITTEYPKAKVVMVTALGQEEKQDEARKNGASGYIRKPFNAKQVIEELERVLGVH